MARPAAWNEYEAALLLDAYLKVLRGEKPRMDSVKECSAQLRQMALNAGEHIDDIYRNVNGIWFQMSSIAYTRALSELILVVDDQVADYDDGSSQDVTEKKTKARTRSS